MKKKLLFIEDEADLGSVVKQYLEIMDFEVVWCKSGLEAFSVYSSDPQIFHLLIIDIQLPDTDGFNLASMIISINPSQPLLFLTARNNKTDKVRGLQLGADDYVTKPFDIEELILRIKNIINRSSITSGTPVKPVDSTINIGDITLNKDLLTLTIANKKTVVITVREAELLEYLCRNPNKILKREYILLELWGQNDYFLGRSLDVFISRLRKLLGPSAFVSINNVYGIGFIFKVKEEA